MTEIATMEKSEVMGLLLSGSSPITYRIREGRRITFYRNEHSLIVKIGSRKVYEGYDLEKGVDEAIQAVDEYLGEQSRKAVLSTPDRKASVGFTLAPDNDNAGDYTLTIEIKRGNVRIIYTGDKNE